MEQAITWEVVGGKEHGGIVSRTGRDLKSWESPEGRLASGALVQQIELVGERLRFKKVSGRGPATGWVSVKLKGKELLHPAPCVETAELPDLERHEGSMTYTSADGKGVCIRYVAQTPKTPSDDHSARCAVVMCPGNPAEKFNCDHAGSTLALAVEAACCKARVPFVRFDYPGVGMNSSAEDPKEWQVPSFEASMESALHVVVWAKKNLSETIILLGYSFGASVARELALKRYIAIYAGVSIGTKIHLFFDSEEEREMLQKQTAEHSLLELPALYICGSKDRMTPRQDVEGLVQARKDGGSGARILTVDGGNHALEGKEEECSAMFVEWMRELLL